MKRNDPENDNFTSLFGQAIWALLWLFGTVILFFLVFYEYFFSDKLVKLLGYSSINQMINDHPWIAVLYIAPPCVVAIRKFNKDINDFKEDLKPIFILFDSIIKSFSWLFRISLDLIKLLIIALLSPIVVPILVLIDVVPKIALWLLDSPVAKITIFAMILNAIVSSYALPSNYTDVPLPVNIESVSSSDRFRGNRKYEPPFRKPKERS